NVQGCGLDCISAGVDCNQIVPRNVLPRGRVDLGRNAVVIVRANVGDVIRFDCAAQRVPRDQLAPRQRHLRGVVHGLSVIHLAAA
ncbi:MAG: hypothetical protein J6R46_06895, partial [Clostridia bacterium]|nr:hypothetical protein [Clostridia bacterium]